MQQIQEFSYTLNTTDPINSLITTDGMLYKIYLNRPYSFLGISRTLYGQLWEIIGSSYEAKDLELRLNRAIFADLGINAIKWTRGQNPSIRLYPQVLSMLTHQAREVTPESSIPPDISRYTVDEQIEWVIESRDRRPWCIYAVIPAAKNPIVISRMEPLESQMYKWGPSNIEWTGGLTPRQIADPNRWCHAFFHFAYPHYHLYEREAELKYALGNNVRRTWIDVIRDAEGTLPPDARINYGIYTDGEVDNFGVLMRKLQYAHVIAPDLSQRDLENIDLDDFISHIDAKIDGCLVEDVTFKKIYMTQRQLALIRRAHPDLDVKRIAVRDNQNLVYPTQGNYPVLIIEEYPEGNPVEPDDYLGHFRAPERIRHIKPNFKNSFGWMPLVPSYLPVFKDPDPYTKYDVAADYSEVEQDETKAYNLRNIRNYFLVDESHFNGNIPAEERMVGVAALAQNQRIYIVRNPESQLEIGNIDVVIRPRETEPTDDIQLAVGLTYVWIEALQNMSVLITKFELNLVNMPGPHTLLERTWDGYLNFNYYATGDDGFGAVQPINTILTKMNGTINVLNLFEYAGHQIAPNLLAEHVANLSPECVLSVFLHGSYFYCLAYVRAIEAALEQRQRPRSAGVTPLLGRSQCRPGVGLHFGKTQNGELLFPSSISIEGAAIESTIRLLTSYAPFLDRKTYIRSTPDFELPGKFAVGDRILALASENEILPVASMASSVCRSIRIRAHRFNRGLEYSVSGLVDPVSLAVFERKGLYPSLAALPQLHSLHPTDYSNSVSMLGVTVEELVSLTCRNIIRERRYEKNMYSRLSNGNLEDFGAGPLYGLPLVPKESTYTAFDQVRYPDYDIPGVNIVTGKIDIGTENDILPASGEADVYIFNSLFFSDTLTYAQTHEGALQLIERLISPSLEAGLHVMFNLPVMSIPLFQMLRNTVLITQNVGEEDPPNDPPDFMIKLGNYNSVRCFTPGLINELINRFEPIATLRVQPITSADIVRTLKYYQRHATSDQILDALKLSAALPFVVTTN